MLIQKQYEQQQQMEAQDRSLRENIAQLREKLERERENFEKEKERLLDCLEGVPDLPVAPQDEAGLTKTFQTWPRGWFHIP